MPAHYYRAPVESSIMAEIYSIIANPWDHSLAIMTSFVQLKQMRGSSIVLFMYRDVLDRL